MVIGKARLLQADEPNVIRWSLDMKTVTLNRGRPQMKWSLPIFTIAFLYSISQPAWACPSGRQWYADISLSEKGSTSTRRISPQTQTTLGGSTILCRLGPILASRASGSNEVSEVVELFCDLRSGVRLQTSGWWKGHSGSGGERLSEPGKLEVWDDSIGGHYKLRINCMVPE